MSWLTYLLTYLSGTQSVRCNPCMQVKTRSRLTFLRSPQRTPRTIVSRALSLPWTCHHKRNAAVEDLINKFSPQRALSCAINSAFEYLLARSLSLHVACTTLPRLFDCSFIAIVWTNLVINRGKLLSFCRAPSASTKLPRHPQLGQPFLLSPFDQSQRVNNLPTVVTCIGVARILSGGAIFLAQKVDDLFLVVALKDRLEIYLQI